MECAKKGHNLLLGGQAGTGKSFVVNVLVKAMTARGRSVAVVCSSGISCTVYGDFVLYTSTVHTFYALQTADTPADMVVDRSKATKHCVQKIVDTDVIIWDEAGMSSKRVLELANAVHHAVADPANRWKPFGGKQFIFVGDFLQLRPVPNPFDSGDFLFNSDLFNRAVPRRLELTQFMRQADAGGRFLQAFTELRMGSCTAETAEYLRTLSRPITGEAIHIYFKKRSVQLHNLQAVEELPGEQLVFPCEDKDDTRGISCPAEETLVLKSGAKVMLVWNLTDKLKNGTPGTFLR